jgi:hypothetical protein
MASDVLAARSPGAESVSANSPPALPAHQTNLSAGFRDSTATWIHHDVRWPLSHSLCRTLRADVRVARRRVRSVIRYAAHAVAGSETANPTAILYYVDDRTINIR